MLFVALLFASPIFSTALSDVIPVVTYRGDSHYDFGYTQGRETAALIAARFAISADLVALLNWYALPGAKEVRDPCDYSNRCIWVLSNLCETAR